MSVNHSFYLSVSQSVSQTVTEEIPVLTGQFHFRMTAGRLTVSLRQYNLTVKRIKHVLIESISITYPCGECDGGFHGASASVRKRSLCGIWLGLTW